MGVVVDAAQFPAHVLSSRPSLCSELSSQLVPELTSKIRSPDHIPTHFPAQAPAQAPSSLPRSDDGTVSQLRSEYQEPLRLRHNLGLTLKQILCSNKMLKLKVGNRLKKEKMNLHKGRL